MPSWMSTVFSSASSRRAKARSLEMISATRSPPEVMTISGNASASALADSGAILDLQLIPEDRQFPAYPVKIRGKAKRRVRRVECEVHVFRESVQAVEDAQTRSAVESRAAKEVCSGQAGKNDLLGDLAQCLLFLERGPARIRRKPFLNDLDTHSFRSFLSPARKRDTRPGL